MGSVLEPARRRQHEIAEERVRLVDRLHGDAFGGAVRRTSRRASCRRSSARRRPCPGRRRLPACRHRGATLRARVADVIWSRSATSTTVMGVESPSRSTGASASPTASCTAGDARSSSTARGLSWLPPKNSVLTTRSARNESSMSAVERGLQRSDEHGDERHHRDADDQRGRGGRRAPGVATGVVRRESPVDASQAVRARRRTTLAAGPRSAGATTNVPATSNTAAASAATTGPPPSAAAMPTAAPGRPGGLHRSLARRPRPPRRLVLHARGERRPEETAAARRAGSCAATTGIRIPTARLMPTARGRTVKPPAGSAPPKASNIAFNAVATPKPPTTPSTAATTPIVPASIATDAAHLAARCPDRPQQGELAGSLGEGDRERVVDGERRDHQRDAGEDDEQGTQGVEERQLVELLVGQLPTGDRLDAVGERRRRCDACSSVAATPGSASHEDGADLARDRR